MLKHGTGHDINAYDATLYLLDQPGLHLKLDQAKFRDGFFSFSISGSSGRYSGTISAGGDALTGTWTEDSEQKMNFARAGDKLAGEQR